LLAVVVSEREVFVDVVIIATDCARELAMVLERIPRRGVRSIVVVDNGSTDNTGLIARDHGAVVLRSKRGGHGLACARAIAHLDALPNHPHIVVFIDPNGPEDPAALPALVDALKAKRAELALATNNDSKARRPLQDRAMLGLIKAIYGHRFAEISNFRAIKYPALVALGMCAEGEGWSVEMMVKAVRLGLDIVEIPVGRFSEARPGRPQSKGTSRKLFRILRHAAAR